MKSTTFLSNGESVFLFQNFHHAADHRGLLVAEGGDVQKAAEKKSVSPLLIIGIALMVLGAGTVAALVILRKTCENEE